MFFNLFSMFEPFFFFFSSMSLNMFFIINMVLFQQNIYVQKKKPLSKESLSNKIIFSFFILFLSILFFNLVGLLPWVFCNTAHISLNAPLAYSIWLMILIWELSSMKMKLVLNMTPKGSPLILSFFLVFVESISKIIQPLTLSLRLTANMIAGHMIISLISSFISTFSFISLTYFIFLVLILFLEVGVAMIQAYVFTYLLYLYSS